MKLGRGGKMGSVNTEQIKGGLKKEQLKDKNMQTIFDSVDANKDGILDAGEIKNFKQNIQNAAGNEKLSNREAKKYLKQNNIKDIKKEDLFKFINTLSQASENIESSTVSENNGQKTVHIKYKDGSTETINPDKSSEVATQGENGETITGYYDKNQKLTAQKVVNQNGETQVTHFDEKEQPTQSQTVGNNGNPVLTVAYKDGKPESSTFKDGTTVESYTYDEEGTPVLNKKVENQGIPAKEKVTEYVQNEDGTVTATITENGKQTVQTIKDGKVQNETINENGKTSQRTYTENGYTEVTDDGATTTNFNNEGKKLSQTKTIDGQTYSVEYDGEGNTKGIIVQNGESIAMLAKKFGCSVEDIINANPELVKGKGDKAYFLVGEEIKIPRELEADDKALQGRTSKEDAIGGYNDYMAKKAAEEAAQQAEQEAAQQAEQDAQEVAEKQKHREEMQKQGKEIANDLFEDMDGIGTKKSFDANIKRINKDNVASVIQAYQEKSPDESLAECILDESGMDIKKRKEALTHIYNQLTARAEELGIDTTQSKQAFEEAMKLKGGYANNEDFDVIFNTLVAGINGKEMLTKADKEEIKNTPPEELQSQTKTLLQDTVNGAEKSLNEQLAKDGWAADLWEGMKWCVGSDNLDEKVKADIDTYKKQVADLNTAKTQEEFKAKFKEIYGVDYDPELVKAYQKRQEQLPLAEATHGIEENFNNTMKDLLASDKLAPKTQYVQTSSFGTGTYQEVASKEQVYNDELNKFAEFVGQGDKEAGLKDIEQAFKDAGLPENASMDEKYKVMHNLAKNYSAILHENTLEATEGKGYEVFTTEAENAYKAAFGLENDIAKRVADYNTSQQTGDMIVKGVVKGGAAIGLALIPGVGLAAAAIGTGVISATVDATDRMSSEVGLKEGELTDILKNAAIDGASVYAGGKLTQMLANAKTFVKIGGQITGDVATGAAAEKLQTGQISLNGVLFQCVFSGAGNLVALKNMGKAPKDVPDVTPQQVKTPPKGDAPKTPKATPQTDAPTLDVASSNGNATPSSVKVGEKKAAAVREEVDNLVNNPKTSGEDLAQIRQEAEGLQNRELRREVEQKLDQAAENLSPEQKAAFDAANKANAQKNVDHIFDKHSELNNADTRVMNEYINNTDDAAVLNELKEKLSAKEHTYGGVTANYDRLRKAIDDKLANLQPKTVKTNAQQREDVVGMLNEKAQSGKGLNGDDFKQINEYITTIDNEADLKELKGLLGGKKMTSAQKKQLKEALASKTEELKNSPPAAEPPKSEEPKAVDNAPEPAAADDVKPKENPEPKKADGTPEQKVYTPTPEEKMAMGQIGVSINSAKGLKDLEKVQVLLDKMPECKQKGILQKQLNIAKQKLEKTGSQQLNDDVNAGAAGKNNKASVEGQENVNSNKPLTEAEIRQKRADAQKAKIKELDSKYQSQITTVTVNGKKVQIKRYINSQQGSNRGYWMQDMATGELSYVKFPPKGRTFDPAIEEQLYGVAAQAKSEALACDLYKAAGLKAPDVDIITDAAGNVGTKSKFLDNLDTPAADNYASIREGFAADCWLANWDALKDGNIKIQNNQAVRTDNGGSLCYRARGARKGTAFGENVDELTSFFGGNSWSKKYLQDMSRDELVNSLKHVTTIDDKTIASIVKKAEANGIQNPEFLKEMLIERRNYMKRFQDLCEKMPQKSGENIEDYIQRIQDITPKTTYNIGKANFDEIPLSSRIYGNLNDYDNYIATVNSRAKLSEHLTPSQKRLFEASYAALERSKNAKIRHNANNILNENNMLHAAGLENLDSILKNGLVSREYSGVVGARRGNGVDPGSMTPMCSDLWDVQSSYTIGDYFSATAKHWANDGETNFLPNPFPRSQRSSLVIVFNKNSVDPTIMNNSFKVSDRSSILYKDGNMGGYKNYTSHRAVPVGLPSNAIDRIIVPAYYSSEQINQIRNSIKKSGLDIKLFDTNGNKI